MTPLPKRKYAKSRQGKRRSHLAIKMPHVVEGPQWCPFGSRQCQGPRLAHHACPICGMYRGRQVIEVPAADE